LAEKEKEPRLKHMIYVDIPDRGQHVTHKNLPYQEFCEEYLREVTATLETMPEQIRKRVGDREIVSTTIYGNGYGILRATVTYLESDEDYERRITINKAAELVKANATKKRELTTLKRLAKKHGIEIKLEDEEPKNTKSGVSRKVTDKVQKDKVPRQSSKHKT
jgi:hypothetical protein